jgi:glycosyltransferase involved in cell wall biosynthesis
VKIGIASHWYDPEGGAAAGPGTVARLLRDRGHEVHVLTGFPQYPVGKVFEGYRLRPYMREVMDGVTVHRAPIYPSHDRRALHRAGNYLSYAASASALAPWVFHDVDAVLVYSTPATAAIPAMTLRRLRGTPYGLWIQDLWPESVTSSGFLANERQSRVAKALHRFCDRSYSGAEVVAAIAPGMLERVRERGVPSEKTRLIPNWADEASFHPATPTAEVRQAIGPLKPFSVMYAGNFGEMQNLETVVAAAEHLRDHRDIGFVLVGGGVQEGRLRDAVAERNLHNVTFAPSQPFHRMSEVLALADVQLVSLKDAPLLRCTIPSKLQANLAVGKPVIGAVAGDPAQIIRESGAGTAVAPGNAQALAEAVLRLRSMDAGHLGRLGQAARSYYLEHFSPSVVGEQLEAMMLAVAARRHGR